MKLLFLLVIASILSYFVYFYFSKANRSTKKKKKNVSKKPLVISAVIFVILLCIIVFGMYQTAIIPDTQCTQIHNTNPVPPVVSTANGYFKLGDFYYDQGNCIKAVTEYTKSIQLNPNFYQAYNNRAYTHMRMQDYKDALHDLNKAIQLNPKYVYALMNRGDIHNYYYQINRLSAIADYERVISITGPSGGNRSVCGHLFLALHGGWTLSTYLSFLTGGWETCK